jgi:hypothetical protein
MSSLIQVQLTVLPPRAQLAAWWRELEARTDASFFTTWSWIGQWLDVLPDDLDVRLLKATCQDRITGLALVVRGSTRLLKHIPAPCWWVHTTGREDLDELTIEYNGFLLDRNLANQSGMEMLRHLLFKTFTGRVNMPYAHGSYARLVEQLGGQVISMATPRESHLVDLDSVRTSEGGYIKLLSANTRSQLRRSLNAYQALGPLTVHEATDLRTANTYLDALRDLHTRSWHQRGVETNFATSPVAHAFHRELVQTAFERGEIQLLRITVGDQDLGYLYNFRFDGRIAFYQSGLNYHLLDKHDRPGMVCHALAIEHNARQGYRLYDFLAGNHRYKASLATSVEPQFTQIIQRKGVLSMLDAAVRDARDWWQQRSRISKDVAAHSLLTLVLFMESLGADPLLSFV